VNVYGSPNNGVTAPCLKVNGLGVKMFELAAVAMQYVLYIKDLVDKIIFNFYFIEKLCFSIK
jgi:hypothetical protein